MLKVLELFAGIGAPRKALERLGIEFETVDMVEIDKYAVKSYNAMYNENYTPQDITEWDKQLDVDMIFHGSPCQDFSLAGKQAGGEIDSGTRSSLMWHTVRIVEKLKPRYVIWENVKNVISKNHRHTFDKYLAQMEELGYTNYYQVLNAKDYGIPQNRERVFTISIKNEIDKDNVEILDIFKFPEKQELKLRLKDMLEDEVDEKYYLSKEMVKYISSDNEKWTGNNDKSLINKEVASAINTGEGSRRCDASNFVSDNYIENLNIKEYRNYISWEDSKGRINTQDHRAFKDDCISGTVPAMERGIPKVIMPEATKKGYAEAIDGDGVYINRPQQKRGVVQKQMIQTLSTQPQNDLGTVTSDLRIRKLTPLEVWRLMGFDDSDYEKASQVNSNAQLYKQAGNSIVVNVLEAIFKELL